MALTPTAQQSSAVYVLTSPFGKRAVFNDPLDADFVGGLQGEDAVTGLDSPEVRQTIHELVEADGAISSAVFHGSRPVTLQGFIKESTISTRNTKETKLREVVNECARADGLLTWTPAGGASHYVRVRKNQPLRVRGGFVKDFFVALIAADPRIYSTALNTLTDTASVTVTNLVTNPSGEVVKKFTDGTDFVVTRELGSSLIPAFTRSFRDKHAWDGAGSVTNTGSVSFTAGGAGTFVASLYVWIPRSWDGGAPELSAENFTSGTETVLVVADLNKRDQWQRISTRFTVDAGDLAGDILVRIPSSPFPTAFGGVFYSDALQIEQSSNTTPYVDGSFDWANWSGTADASTSTTNQLQVTAVNDGNADSPPALIRVSGSATDPAVIREASGTALATLSFPGLVVASGQHLDIDVLNKTAFVTDGSNAFGFIDFPTFADWWELRPGTNEIYVRTSVDSSEAMRVDFRDVWL